MTDEPTVPDAATGIDTSTLHSARIWNYWLGGTDNYEVDRAAGEAWISVDPGVTTVARGSRAYLKRTVRWLAAEAGIRQFLDIGTGLPTAENTHEVAQRVAPDSRIVYVDHDPLVLAHARALLTSTDEGVTHYLDADMHDPAALVRGAARTLDLNRPVGVLFMGVLGHIADLDDARDLVRFVMDRTCPGSYLVVNDGTHEFATDAVRKAQQDYSDTGAVPYLTREPVEIESFFEGLEFVEPGFVSVSQWRPDPAAGTEPVDAFGGVGRKI